MDRLSTIGLTLFLWGCSVTPVQSSGCTWRECLTAPSRAVPCECLAAKIEACRDTRCEVALKPTSEEVTILARSIRPAARQEAALAFATLPLLDGGDLEDVMRALSALTADDPQLLLELMTVNAWDAERVRSLVRMLSLETVDQPAEKLRHVRMRLDALRKVEARSLGPVRAIAIDALEEYAAQLNR